MKHAVEQLTVPFHWLHKRTAYGRQGDLWVDKYHVQQLLKQTKSTQQHVEHSQKTWSAVLRQR